MYRFYSSLFSRRPIERQQSEVEQFLKNYRGICLYEDLSRTDVVPYYDFDFKYSSSEERMQHYESDVDRVICQVQDVFPDGCLKVYVQTHDDCECFKNSFHVLVRGVGKYRDPKNIPRTPDCDAAVYRVRDAAKSLFRVVIVGFKCTGSLLDLEKRQSRIVTLQDLVTFTEEESDYLDPILELPDNVAETGMVRGHMMVQYEWFMQHMDELKYVSKAYSPWFRICKAFLNQFPVNMAWRLIQRFSELDRPWLNQRQENEESLNESSFRGGLGYLFVHMKSKPEQVFFMRSCFHDKYSWGDFLLELRQKKSEEEVYKYALTNMKNVMAINDHDEVLLKLADKFEIMKTSDMASWLTFCFEQGENHKKRVMNLSSVLLAMFRKSHYVYQEFRFDMRWDEAPETMIGLLQLPLVQPSQRFTPVVVLEQKIPRLLHHIKHVLLGSEEQSYAYVMGWLFRIIVRHEHMHTVLMFVGQQGSGKSTLPQWIARNIFGPTGLVMSSSRFLDDRFNGELLGKEFVLVDEMDAQSLDSRGKNLELIKGMITSPTIQINEKYKRKMELKNVVNYMFTSNHYKNLIMEVEQRRFVVFYNRRDHLSPTYFEELYEELEDPATAHAFVDYLAYNNAQWCSNMRKIPRTRIMQSMELRSTDSSTIFFKYVDRRLTVEPDTDEFGMEEHLSPNPMLADRRYFVTMAHFYRCYQAFCQYANVRVQEMRSFVIGVDSHFEQGKRKRIGANRVKCVDVRTRFNLEGENMIVDDYEQQRMTEILFATRDRMNH